VFTAVDVIEHPVTSRDAEQKPRTERRCEERILKFSLEHNANLQQVDQGSSLFFGTLQSFL
jgi:hypothetical protein